MDVGRGMDDSIDPFRSRCNRVGVADIALDELDVEAFQRAGIAAGAGENTGGIAPLQQQSHDIITHQAGRTRDKRRHPSSSNSRKTSRRQAAERLL
jgi:hypothetical protein